MGALPQSVARLEARPGSYARRSRVENAVTLEEIARLAGVSRSTVSRVVNDDRRVSDAARLRVQEIIRDHDYHPHAAARSLASRRMRVLGLLVSKSVGGLFTDPFYPILIQGTAEACNAADHTLTMLMDTSADGHAVDQLYGRVIRGRHVDGLVLACHDRRRSTRAASASGRHPVRPRRAPPRSQGELRRRR